jgi:hypothetical protein
MVATRFVHVEIQIVQSVANVLSGSARLAATTPEKRWILTGEGVPERPARIGIRIAIADIVAVKCASPRRRRHK